MNLFKGLFYDLSLKKIKNDHNSLLNGIGTILELNKHNCKKAYELQNKIQGQINELLQLKNDLSLLAEKQYSLTMLLESTIDTNETKTIE